MTVATYKKELFTHVTHYQIIKLHNKALES